MNRDNKEVDLIEVIQVLFNNKMFILKVSLVFFVFGGVIAFFSPKEYTAKTVMVPQIQKTNASGGFSNLAAIAGINLNTTSGDVLPTTIYPKIISSVPFKKKLIETNLTINNISKSITYKEFYLNRKSFFKDFFKSNKKKVNKTDSLLTVITEEELGLFKRLDKQIKLEIDDKTELINLGVSMPQSLASAQMTKAAKKHLQSIIIEIKVKKAKENLKFINKTYQESKKKFEDIDARLARFRDSNRGLITSKSRRILSKLENEYNLSFQIYSELSKRLETQRIKVEEVVPVFSTIEPVVIPLEKSKPKRLLIVVMFVVLGLASSSIYILVKEVLKNRIQ